MSEILVGHEHTMANLEAMIAGTKNPIHIAALVEARNMVRGQATTIAALRKEAAEAIANAHYEGFVDGKQGAGNYSHYDTSTARRAAQRIGGDHG